MRMQPPPLTHPVKPFWHHNLATFKNQPDAMANHPLPLCIMHALCGDPVSLPSPVSPHLYLLAASALLIKLLPPVLPP